jgi:hypothetical protein
MKEKINYTRTLTYTILYLGMFAMGVVFGMMLQQAIFQSTLMKVAGNMDGVQIDVNFNETLMMDSMFDNFEQMGLFNETNQTHDALNVKEVSE